jgi:hypothetical protein
LEEETGLNAAQMESRVAESQEPRATGPELPAPHLKLTPDFILSRTLRFTSRTWKKLKQDAEIFGFVFKEGVGTLTGKRESPSRFLKHLFRLFSKSGRTKLAAQLKRARAAKSNSPQALADLLNKVGAASSAGRSIGYSAAAKIGELMATDGGRDRLKDISKSVLEVYPDSTYLIYIHSVILAKDGRINEAHEHVTQAIERAGQAKAAGKPPNPRALAQLTSIWRTVDLIARDGMTWTGVVDDGGDSDRNPQDRVSPRKNTCSNASLTSTSNPVLQT